MIVYLGNQEHLMNIGLIVGIALGAVAVLSGLLVIVYFFILRERIFKKQIREIDRRVQFLHALLIGQDAQYVKRLEIISRTNLLYVDIHTKFLKRFKDLKNKNDIDAESAIDSLRDYIESKNFKAYKENLPRVTQIVDEYDDLVNSLNADLLKVVKPEEDCRQSALTYKEQLRRIKQDYYSKESELVLMSQSFDEVFAFIDKKFEDFETLVESAQYDEANSILPNIDEILHELTIHMSDLPALCTMVSSVIPDKIASVEMAYKELIEQKYPLYHLCVPQTIEEFNKELEEITHQIRIFKVAGLADRLEDISNKLDAFFTSFDEEKAAREMFENNNESVYSTVNLIERNFIKLRNTIPEVGKFFIINEDHKTKINNIQNNINKVGALKRSLDTFIHSATKQPYSILLNKMDELSAASNAIISDIEEYNSYISSLKADAEKAYAVVFEAYDKVKTAEYQVSKMNVKKVSEKYQPQFDQLYKLLNDIYNCLITNPIDIDKVNSLLHEYYEIANVILDSGEVSADYNLMVLAENSILFANRHRYHLADVDSQLSLAETYFQNGDFQNASITASNVLKRIKESNGR
ncbi:MAG: hypothetical protein IKP50_02955 [Bacilli bacterium]|nr:hypothetical protein [Bacilli bacterium]